MSWNIIRLDQTSSTMDDAAKLPPGSVVVAESQTAGQGRMGRSGNRDRVNLKRASRRQIVSLETGIVCFIAVTAK